MVKDRCFILGTSPGILDIDLSLLKNEITIGMNNILRSGFVPNYLCVSDGYLIERDFDHVFSDSMIDRQYVFCDRWIHYGGKLKEHLDNKFNIMYIPNVEKEDESYYIDPDLKSITFTGSTSVHDLAVPLAVHLGFKKIYLLGCDGGIHHFYDEDKSYVQRMNENFEKKWPGRQGRYKHVTKWLDKFGVELFNSDPSDRLRDIEYRDFNKVISMRS